MIDYKTRHPAIQKTVEDTLQSTAQQIGNRTPDTQTAVTSICDLLDHFSTEDQLIACAFALGQLWASWQGAPTEFEADKGMLLTMEDRRILFDALTEVIYREAAEFRAHPDAPKERCN